MEQSKSLNLMQVGEIIQAAKKLAERYREITGRPLGITGEVAEYEVARILDLDLAVVRQPGYDAIRAQGKRTRRFQIKGRCILSPKSGQRLSKIDLGKDWDAVLLVLLDTKLEPMAICEAERPEIVKALMKPGSKARNERGALSVSKFKSISKLVWSQQP